MFEKRLQEISKKFNDFDDDESSLYQDSEFISDEFDDLERFGAISSMSGYMV